MNEKRAGEEKIGFFCGRHYRIYSPEWMAVDGSAHSHSEFNLSTLKMEILH